MTSGVDLRGGLRFYRQLSRKMAFSRPSRILAESDSSSSHGIFPDSTRSVFYHQVFVCLEAIHVCRATDLADLA